VAEMLLSSKMFTRDNKAKIKERVDFVLRVLLDAHNKLPQRFQEECKRVAIARAM
jgi:phospholipid/cholesterol/gamma-HCH transport system ATP-binding protein